MIGVIARFTGIHLFEDNYFWFAAIFIIGFIGRFIGGKLEKKNKDN
ncbi:hypothetical protein J7E67_26475 [Bacillus sp. ISL-46]|nr:hypothetical protein [Bacillus sp. ISL-46]